MPFVPPGTEEPSPTGVDAHMGGGCKDTTSFGSVKTEDNWPAYQDKNEPNGAGPYQPMMPFAAPPMPPAGSSSQILAQYAANLQAMAQQYSQMASVAATQEMARGSELGNMPNMSMPALGMPINPWLLPDPLSMPGTGDFRRTEAEAKTNEKTELAPVKNESEWVTVMIRNLPNDYGRDDVVEFLNLQGFKARFDFVYLPIDFKNSTGLGYAFVNMVGHEDALEVFRRLEGFKDWKVSSQKVCEVAWGNPEQQGLDFHISRYRNSPVMHNSVPEEFKPLIFQNGEKVPFPEPTKAPRRPRMKKHARIGCRSPDASEEEEQGTQ
ncbi:unnamed protein product [Effrenium voratum]|nr:unnamed protein product [Effrenium voratum]